MAPSRSSATATSTMETLVRKELSDPATDRAGNTITNTRFTSDDVLYALKHAAMFLQRKNRLVSPGDALVYTDGTYTANAFSVAIPGAGYFDPIVKVENIEDSQRPIVIPAITLEEIERYALSSQTTAYVPRGYPYRHTLIDVDTARHIIIRPRPSGSLAIRVWRVAPPMIWGSGENNEQASHWEDLLVLLAAQELLSRREGMSEGQNARLSMLLAQYTAAANRRRQPQRIRRGRQGWS